MFDNFVICPWKYGQLKNGVDKGALVLEKYIKQSCIYGNFITVSESNKDNNSYHERVYTQSKSLYGNTLCLGGDHSVAIGSVLSSLEKNPETCVIWIDAHPDMHTIMSSTSKNVHGMPLSFICGTEKSWKWTQHIPKLGFENLYYFGIRDCDDYETSVIKDKNINILRNVTEIIQLMKLNKYTHFHISFDVDSLDPSYMISTGTKSEYGIEPSEIEHLFTFLKSQEKCVNIDIVEYNPEIGDKYECAKSKNVIENIIKCIL